MSVTQINIPPSAPEANGTTPTEPRPQGIYALPYVGPKFQQARDVTEGLRPDEGDSTAQVIAKRVAQASVVTGTAAVAALVIL